MEINVALGTFKMEEGRVVWTMSNNIYIWSFYTVKDLEFTQKSTGEEEEATVVRKLVFFDGQVNHIVNLDKSGLTLDGTNSLLGGSCATKSGSENESAPNGVDICNKRSYQTTQIGRIIVAAGYRIPSNF